MNTTDRGIGFGLTNRRRFYVEHYFACLTVYDDKLTKYHKFRIEIDFKGLGVLEVKELVEAAAHHLQVLHTGGDQGFNEIFTKNFPRMRVIP
jgi:hypothetical protein